jgi:rhodanese-related sulfurtransferase
MSFDITPAEYEVLRAHYPNVQLLDVREEEEFQQMFIPGALLIPLGELPDKIENLDRNKHYVVYCRSGIRSLKAVHWMLENGFKKVQNLTGGILAWEACKGEIV